MNFVVDALDRHSIPYAITGSHASSVFGETRFTNDIDVVIQLSSQELLKKFLGEFPEESYYVSDVGARHAVSHGGQFNIIHQDSAQKVDLIIPEKINWPDQLARRTKVATAQDREIWFVSPEDLILKKMDFYREGGSEKHLRDIAGTLRISGEKIDRAYVSQWAEKLGLSNIWKVILDRAK
jgi:hypothetical protein